MGCSHRGNRREFSSLDLNRKSKSMLMAAYLCAASLPNLKIRVTLRRPANAIPSLRIASMLGKGLSGYKATSAI
jgi:hypothetical protein